MDEIFYNFISSSWISILFILILLIPIIPPEWIGLKETYKDLVTGKEEKVQKCSIIRAIIRSLLEPIIEFLVFWSLKGTVSIVIFAVIGADLFYRKQISKEAIILVSIGIVALYFDQLISSAKRIRAWFFEWESKEPQNNR